MKTNTLHKIAIVCLTVVIAFWISGCTSTKGVIGFEKLNYPASMSAFLYDANYNTVMKGKELETLNSFKYRTTYWSLAYGLIPLNPADRISDTLNKMVDYYGGDGIINLSVTIEHGDLNKVVSFLMYLPGYIPAFPSGAKITVTGEIVKLKRPEGYSIITGNPYIKYIKANEINIKIKEALNEII